jgi:hypothetical protein
MGRDGNGDTKFSITISSVILTYFFCLFLIAKQLAILKILNTIEIWSGMI